MEAKTNQIGGLWVSESKTTARIASGATISTWSIPRVPPEQAAATFASPAPASGSEKVASQLFLISLPPAAAGEQSFRILFRER
jgi:hypothetical protein